MCGEIQNIIQRI